MLLISQILESGSEFKLGSFMKNIDDQARAVLELLESNSITENGFLGRKSLENLRKICSKAYEFIKLNLIREEQRKTKGNTQFSSRISMGSKTINDLCKIYDSSTIDIEKFGQLVKAFYEVITNIVGLLELAAKNSNINKKYEIEEINKKLKDATTGLIRLKDNLIEEKK